MKKLALLKPYFFISQMVHYEGEKFKIEDVVLVCYRTATSPYTTYHPTTGLTVRCNA